MNKLHSPDSINDSEIAIIGMSGRFPGAKDVEAFWQNLCEGQESISFFSAQELISAGIEPTLLSDPNYIKARAVLSDIDSFDASFFGFTAREAEMMDPQHRLFLECAWQAIESAGYDAETYEGSIGVYAGVSMNTYLLNNLYQNRELFELFGYFQSMIGNDKDFLATRVSYKLNLKGPSVNVQTACSTSLVAVHLACQSLLNGECDLALAGGISLRVPHKVGYLYQDGMIFSPDGHCRAFDARAQGTVGGSGVGIVMLKRLREAMADGDDIHAIIKGSAINNDGSLKVGYTAPSVDGQAAVISEAQAIAGICAETVTYIEAHGTGTALGDPIELAALTQAFRDTTHKRGFCAIGSVKTNIGHTDTAAGVAGLIKTVLALKHKLLPPSLHFDSPNPQIDFANSPFYVNTKLSEWKSNGTARRAGVSSFGIGGTNAHVVLEEAPPHEPSGKSRAWQLLLISAKTASALDTATANLAEHLGRQRDLNLADVAYTLQVGRRTFSQRRMVVCQNLEDARTALGDPKRIWSAVQEAKERPVAFMFPGGGAQYVNMARELYQVEPIFREQVDICAELLQPQLGLDLRNLLYVEPELIEEASVELKRTSMALPALFVTEYALAKLWMAWGIHPATMIGHSLGEYVAACLAGVFSLQDALALVALRGQLFEKLPQGAMLSVPLSEEKLQPLLGHQLSVAAINAPSLCVVSGPTDAIDELEASLADRGVEYRRLYISVAAHSKVVEPILETFERFVEKLHLQAPRIPYISNVTGNWITAAEATDPSYWAKHLRQTVRFAEGLALLDSTPILLEVGPGRTLSTLARQQKDKTNERVVLSSLRHPRERQSDMAFLLTTLGKLWLAGVQVDWSGFYAHERRHRLRLPTYPFERQRYWIDPPKQARHVRAPRMSLGKKPDIADWFYLPFWKQSVPKAQLAQGDLAASWLLFVDECGLGSQLVKQLTQEARQVITVRVGAEFTKLNDHDYILNPRQPNDYDALLNELRFLSKSPKTMVHLWSVTPNAYTEFGVEGLDNQDLGFYSLLYLAQALGKQNRSDEIQILVVSNQLQEVTGEEVLCPEKATLLGPVKVIPQEYPNISCRSIDVVIPKSGTWQEEKLIEQLLAELTAKSPDLVVAYRRKHRWVQTFEPVRLDKSGANPRLREEGVYLITGGLGGIGLVLAEQLAKTVRAKLILTGRSAFPARDEWNGWLTTHEKHDNVSRQIRKVQELEELGAEVLVICADVANQEQMQEVITQAYERFDQIHGVIHAAGVSPGGVIQLKTREMAESILAPKVRGTLVLDAILKDFKLDFLVLCSSLSSIMGQVGMVDHCGANAFLDAFAHRNTGDDRFTVSINWDAWQEVGQAAEAAKQRAGTLEIPKLQSTKVPYPLFSQCIVDSQGHEIYVTNFSVSKHWVLHDHRVMGKATLPGTAYLEMARAAFEKHAKNGTIEIRQVYFLTPLMVGEDEEKEVRTILKKQEDGFEFFIMSQLDSGQDKWQEHAKGEIAYIETEPQKKHEIKEIEAICNNRKIIITEEEPKPQAEFLEVGSRWHNLKWVKFGTNQGLGLLELPEAFAAESQEYKLHPALLDSATGFLSIKNEGAYLPFSYKRLRVKGPLPRKVLSYIRYTENNQSRKGTLKFNITIMDDQGTELVEIDEYALRKVDIDRLTAKQSRTQSEETAPVPESQNFCLEISSLGILDTLTFRPATRQKPGPGEVEIEVGATALNFKEILLALGMLPVPPDIPLKFGLECAGKIVALGEGVEGFEIGDEVIAFASACFSAFVTTSASLVVPKPDQLSLEDATTIPVAFTTAYYSLIQLGRLCQGERVLIHAAAGGVGMAAVQIAQWVGAEIFATAGNQEKRAFLHSLGIEHVMDSRSLAFADEVMKRTDGRGVDVVLNSLGGEFIPKSLSILAPYGRFLEIGKRDIFENSQLGLRPFEKSLSFFAISVGPKLPNFSSLWREVVQHFKEGNFSPLPHRVFPITEVVRAFEYMAQAKHIGKIVVSVQDKETVRTLIASEDGVSMEESGNAAPPPTWRPLSSVLIPVGSDLHEKNAAPQNVFQRDIKEGLLSAEGVDAFGRILCNTWPQVIVSTRDLETQIEQNNAITVLNKDLDKVKISKQARPRTAMTHAYVAARNELERNICRVWQDFIGIEQVGIHDDFFELGGDSLQAVQLISKLRETIQTELSPHSLLNAPTVAALAEFIKETTSIPDLPNRPARQALPSLLVEIQRGSSLKQPLFLVHPIGGHVYLYRDLAHNLGSDQPVYGLQAQGLDGETPPLTRIEQMATHYIESLRVVQSEGPYLIGGASFGGVVAFEMAHQLHTLGQKVALLAMIDTPIPGHMTAKLEDDAEILAYLLSVDVNFSVSLDYLRKLEPDKQLLYFLEQGKIANRMLPDLGLTQLRHFLHLFKVHNQAMLNYAPRDYPGRVIYFRASEREQFNLQNPELAWIDLAVGGIESHEVPGNHLTMNYPPHVQVLAKRLRAYLDQAQ